MGKDEGDARKARERSRRMKVSKKAIIKIKFMRKGWKATQRVCRRETTNNRAKIKKKMKQEVIRVIEYSTCISNTAISSRPSSGT